MWTLLGCHDDSVPIADHEMATSNAHTDKFCYICLIHLLGQSEQVWVFPCLTSCPGTGSSHLILPFACLNSVHKQIKCIYPIINQEFLGSHKAYIWCQIKVIAYTLKQPHEYKLLNRDFFFHLKCFSTQNVMKMSVFVTFKNKFVGCLWLGGIWTLLLCWSMALKEHIFLVK